VKDLNTRVKKEKQLEWRRRQVFELSSKGHSQTEIANTLQISEPTISRDLAFLRQQSKTNIRKYIGERLPEEYEKCLVGLTAILREAWNTSQQTRQEREKIQALSLAKECYSMKLDLLTNATVVDDAIRFVSEHNNHEKPEKRLGERKQDSNGNDNDNNEIIKSTATSTTNNQVF
jgi:predicted transcriptional regulator